jgi:hypothetical protein
MHTVIQSAEKSQGSKLIVQVTGIHTPQSIFSRPTIRSFTKRNNHHSHINDLRNLIIAKQLILQASIHLIPWQQRVTKIATLMMVWRRELSLSFLPRFISLFMHRFYFPPLPYVRIWGSPPPSLPVCGCRHQSVSRPPSPSRRCRPSLRLPVAGLGEEVRNRGRETREGARGALEVAMERERPPEPEEEGWPWRLDALNSRWFGHANACGS